MLGMSRHSRMNGGGDLERRLQSLEQLLKRDGSRVSATAVTPADQIGETVAAVLNSIAERFRGGASSMSDEASKFGNQAAALGNDAMRRLSKEVAHRPLVTLGIAVAVGLLLGFASHRR
jgi:ElaB/YqjD/DUF883 family membrane-anchored ribosome-binding protein